MRLKSQFWVQAYLRRCAIEHAPAVLVRRGAEEAGAIFIQVNRLDGTCQLYGPAPAGLDDADRDRSWMRCLGDDGGGVAEADAYMGSQYSFDPDIWLIEVEDRAGAHRLDDRVVEN